MSINIYNKDKKYKKKYVITKKINLYAGSSLSSVSRNLPMSQPIILTRERITRPIQLEHAEELEDGELWIFNSSLSKKGRSCDTEGSFKNGHLGISFDRKNIEDVDKKIYGFGPISNNWENGCVEGSLINDIRYFIKFYKNCSNIDDPLYKINIKYNPSKVEDFFKTSGTYSDPIMGDRLFDLKFSRKSEYNNCVTYVTNNIEPLIQVNENSYIIIQSEYIDDVGMYPGGWISEFINVYARYGSKIF
tara:strand:- start:263 stop:1003 length:741 start_codon:yes stop_codon:yes gene_type:complete